MAMREKYWNDTPSIQVETEKNFLQASLMEQDVYTSPSEEDAKYLFFSLPSIIIVKGYALGFTHETVQDMIVQYIRDNRMLLKQKSEIKVQFNM